MAASERTISATQLLKNVAAAVAGRVIAFDMGQLGAKGVPHMRRADVHASRTAGTH